MLWLLDSKTRSLCPSESKSARFQASLSSPVWRGTMPAQPSNGFFIHKPSQDRGIYFAGAKAVFFRLNNHFSGQTLTVMAYESFFFDINFYLVVILAADFSFN